MPLCCVNLSSTSLCDPTFGSYVQSELKHSNISGKSLCFELAELDLIRHHHDVQALMDILRPLGCRFTVDGFVGSNEVSFAPFKDHLHFLTNGSCPMFKKFLVILALFYAAVCFAGIDVNKATEAELDSINGIGPAMSSKILDQRKQGNFNDWNDFISRVRGMGQKNAVRFSSQGLTVNGAAFEGAPAAPAAKPAASAAAK